MVLGNMEIGISTANLVGIVIVLMLAAVNIFGMKFGALLQNVFTVAKALSLAGLFFWGSPWAAAPRHRRQLRQPLEPVLA